MTLISMKVWSQIFFLKRRKVRKLRVIEVEMNFWENCHVFHFIKVQVGINSKPNEHYLSGFKIKIITPIPSTESDKNRVKIITKQCARISAK